MESLFHWGKQLPPSIRTQDINKTCWPGFAFRCSWRQMNTELVSRTDKQQRRLYGCALAHRMRADETMEQFMNRRKHAALTEVRRHGKWSWKAAVRIVLWDLHLPRNHSGAWVCGLRNWKGDIWLRTRRMLMNSVSSFGGSTGTRRSPGHPRTRWHDGVQFALDKLGDP